MVAEAFLTVVFEKLFEQLASPELRKSSLASKVKELEEKLKKARLLLDDSEDRELTEPRVKEWLEDLKHVVFMADDMVEEIKRESVTVQGEIDLILTDLDILFDRSLVLDLKNGDSQSSRSKPRFIAFLREKHHVLGRESDKEKILELLLSEEDKIGVVPIVGMGGLGKTTLARLVFDDKRVDEHGFSLKAWVTVSTEFDFCRIAKELLKKLDFDICYSDSHEPKELQRFMKEAVRGKRFLFVLDDVWDESYDNWDLLMNNFAAAGDRRSRVIVTTRSGVVGSIVKTGPIYDLKKVGDEDCWSIFVQHAFNGDVNSDLGLEEIGRRIVEKCKGVPLSVKSIAGLLRSERDPEKWESILKSSVWELSNNGILPSLWLSYRYLPSSLKQCFAYCSLFPQDHEFDKKQMCLLWMAEGFVSSNEEEVGEQYFDDLISRSLFQRSIRDESKFVMHDLVHDLAAFVSGQFCFRIEEESNNLRNLAPRTRRLSYSNASAEYDLLSSLSTAEHLRTFITLNHWATFSDGFIEKIATKVRRLRVLSLFLESPALRCSLGDLKNLRYLNLSESNIEEVPNSICSLFNLQTLLLSNCLRLFRLPTNMGKLIKLRHIDTSGSWSLMKMPPNMGNLKELRILTDFILGEVGGSGFSSLRELGELRRLSGTLRISNLQYLRNIKDAQKANMRDKAEIKELILEWDEYTPNTREVNVLDPLRPHTNLEKLYVYSYPCSSFPTWVGESSFSKMVSVKICGGVYNFCRSLPPLGQLPSLRELVIREFHLVEKIGSEFYSNDSSSIAPFRCLESLVFIDMNIWKEWLFIGGDGNESKCFPSLKHLNLNECPQLILGPESLPDCEQLEELHIWGSYSSMEFFPLDKFPNLKSLALTECPNLKALTSNNSTEDHRLIPSLTSMKISYCLEMESFPKRGLPSNLNSLEIENCIKLVAQNRNWDLQKLTSLVSLTVGHCDAELDSFPIGLFPNSLTYFKIWRLPHVKSLSGSAFEKLESLKKMIIWDCKSLESLPKQVLKTASLYFLEISECPFLERRYQKDKGHDWHKISHIPQIYISGFTTNELEWEERKRRSSKNSGSTNVLS